MKIKRGDYTFSGEDTRPHRWALKINGMLVQLERLAFPEFLEKTPDICKHSFGQPTMYYVADDGGTATFYPPADKEYELVQLSN
jgi:hypothetical protein